MQTRPIFIYLFLPIPKKKAYYNIFDLCLPIQNHLRKCIKQGSRQKGESFLKAKIFLKKTLNTIVTIY